MTYDHIFSLTNTSLFNLSRFKFYEVNLISLKYAQNFLFFLCFVILKVWSGEYRSWAHYGILDGIPAYRTVSSLFCCHNRDLWRTGFTLLSTRTQSFHLDLNHLYFPIIPAFFHLWEGKLVGKTKRPYHLYGLLP